MPQQKFSLLAILTLLPLLLTGCAAVSAPTPTRTPDIMTMAALGDSISVASAACGYEETCLPDSWSTGSNAAINSHAHRIAELQHKAIVVNNDAVAGAHMADLPAQVATAITQKPAYVTILIGANDYCAPATTAMTDPTAFGATFSQALTSLTTALPKTKIFVSSLPNPDTLWRAGRSDTHATTVWSYAGICQSMLAAPNDTGDAANARRQQVIDRAQAYNTALAQTCNTYANCRYDGGAIYNTKFDASELSTVDYFHPGITGQAKLAQVTWDKAHLGAFLADNNQ